MANKFTESELQELREAFDLFDKDNNDRISVEELATAVRSLGINPSLAQIEEMHKEVDTDGSGMVDFDEFVTMMSKRDLNENEDDSLKKAFRVFDRDGNGFISTSELRHVLTNLGETMNEEEVDAMISEADINGDGVVNYEEFVDMIAPQQKLRKK